MSWSLPRRWTINANEINTAYNLVLNTAYMAVYVRKDRDISCKKRGIGEWVLIEEKLAAVYLPRM